MHPDTESDMKTRILALGAAFAVAELRVLAELDRT